MSQKTDLGLPGKTALSGSMYYFNSVRCYDNARHVEVYVYGYQAAYENVKKYLIAGLFSGNFDNPALVR